MKSGLKIISIALIMLTGTSYAYAGAWGRPRMVSPPPRMMHQPRQQEPRPQEQRPQRPPQQQIPGNPMSAPGGQVRPLDPRNPGQRMSIEERQRLRRQINEAGQDIYAQKR